MSYRGFWKRSESQARIKTDAGLCSSTEPRQIKGESGGGWLPRSPDLAHAGGHRAGQITLAFLNCPLQIARFQLDGRTAI